MKFFSPTAKFKELLLLEHIENKPRTSQHEIARAIGSAASMVNVYMDKFEEKGYLVRDYQSLKIVNYNITPEGIKRKNYLSITYLHELLSLYRVAEENIEKFLQKLENKGYKNILFYGAGEAADSILGVIKGREGRNLKVLAIIDDNKELQGQIIHGYNIISREEIKDYKHDGIVITSYAFEGTIMDRLRDIKYPDEKIEKFFSEFEGVK